MKKIFLILILLFLSAPSYAGLKAVTGIANVNAVTGTLPVVNGGTGLTSIGSANQCLAVNSGGTSLTYTSCSANNNVPTAQYGRGFGNAYTAQCAGYSICSYYASNATSNYPTYGIFKSYNDQGILTWLQRFSRGRIYMDLSDGYAGPSNGIAEYVVQNGGSNYSGSDTVTAITGCTSNPVPGALTVVGGVIKFIALGSQGYGCNGVTPISITTSTVSGFVGYGVTGSSGTYGDGGETTTQFLARLSDITAATSNIIILHIGGINDQIASIPLSTTEANLTTIYNTLLASGKIVVDVMEGPILTSAGTRTAAQYKQIIQLNQWRKKYIQRIQGAQANGGGKIFYLDATPEATNTASAAGAPLTNMVETSVGVHPQTPYAMIEGWKLWQEIKPLVGSWGEDIAGNQLDVYDATNNPYGFLTSDPFMTSSGGTATSPCTGTVASGWTLGNISGTGTGTCTAQFETTRTDLFSGQRQQFTILTGGLTNHEQYSYVQSGTISSLNISIGETIYAVCDVEITNGMNINNLALGVGFFNSTPTVIAATFDGGNTQYTLNNSNSLGGLDATKPMTMRTPPMVTPATTNSINISFAIQFDGSGASNSAGATVKLTNCGVKQWI